MNKLSDYIYYEDKYGKIYLGDTLDVLKSLDSGIVQTCITSPPYWGLRDYGEDGQYGLEKTPEEFIENMVAVFGEVRRVLRDDGTLWLNMGDSYASDTKGDNRTREDYIRQGATVGALLSGAQNAGGKRKCCHGLKPKDLCGIPWRLALALQSDGWYLRSDIIWKKPNPMPESVTDRPTKSHEYIFLLTKKPKYFYDADAVREPHSTPIHKPQNKNLADGKNDNGHLDDREWGNPAGRNLRDVWTIATQACSFAHFATFPTALVDKCLMAGSKPKSIVLDPFGGTGTVAQRAKELGREYIHIDLSEKYNEYAKERLAQEELF